MKKNLLVVLVAGLLLLSATACKKDPETPDDTNSIDTTETTGGYIGVETDTDGNPATNPADPEDTDAPETDAFDPSEENAVFTDVTMEISSGCAMILFMASEIPSDDILGDFTSAFIFRLPAPFCLLRIGQLYVAGRRRSPWK